MYTILLGDDNELVTSVEERIIQRSKLVDSLHFLVEPIYKEEDMAGYICMMEYRLPESKEYKSEILTVSDELYKNMLEYKLPLDTNLTAEAGDVEVYLTFSKVEMLADGTGIQHVRKTRKGTIHITAIEDWAAMIPDAALGALDQRMVEAQILINQLVDANKVMDDSKADGLSYEEGLLQLLANGTAIGNAVKIPSDGSSDPVDGNIRVVEF